MAKFKVKYSKIAIGLDKAYKHHGLSRFLTQEKAKEEKLQRKLEKVHSNSELPFLGLHCEQRKLNHDNKLPDSTGNNKNFLSLKQSAYLKPKLDWRYLKVIPKSNLHSKSTEIPFFEPKKKTSSVKRIIEKFPMKEEVFAIIQLAKKKAPSLGQYAPKYGFVHCKSPSFNLSQSSFDRNAYFWLIPKDKINQTRNISCKKFKDQLPPNLHFDGDCGKQIQSNEGVFMQSVDIIKSMSSSPNMKKLHGMTFEKYAPRTSFGNKSITTVLSYIEPEKSNSKYVKTPIFSKMSPRKEKKIPNYPTSLDYSPKYTFVMQKY